MPPVDAGKERPLHVHLTGFGPFRNVPVNPSWLAVQPLDGQVLTEPPAPLVRGSSEASAAGPGGGGAGPPPPQRRPIRITASLLPVEYVAVERLAPALQEESRDPGSPPPDVVIHVGVSGSDSAIRLEQRARKVGYLSPDAQGRLAPAEGAEGAAQGARRGFVGEEWAEAPEELRTRVDGERVIERVKGRGVEYISLSEDAGLYLCEYSFFASLATAQRLNPSSPTPVQFVHVPPVGRPYSVEELTAALKLIVWAIGETLP
ncbi:hypothetical protein JCM8202_005811 [Rhodotorula sphaerocarpa]